MTTQQEILMHELQAQRNHILQTVAEMPEQWLLQQALPTRWSPAGLIHHLTHDVERFWFSKVLLNDPTWQPMPDGTEAWDVPTNKTGTEIMAEYRAKTDRISASLSQLNFDHPPAWWDVELFGHSAPNDLGEILLHVIVETATHAGHMDIVRELYDGHQNLVLTDESRAGR